MRVKVTTFAWLIVICSCVLLTVPSRLPVRAEEPLKVQSTMEPFESFGLVGTRKITTQTFRTYEITDERISARDKHGAYRFDHKVSYKDLDKRLLKLASTFELSLPQNGIRKETNGDLWWQEPYGVRVEIGCENVQHDNGGVVIMNQLHRINGQQFVSATGIEINRNPHTGTTYHQLVVENGITNWIKVDALPKDETGCADPKFPFEMLREKPL